MFINFYTFLISYIFIICSTLGYGFLVEKLLNKSFTSKNLGYLGLTGVFFLVVYSYFSSLFIGHNLIHNSLLLGFGFVIFIIKSNYFKNIFFKDYYFLFVIFGILLVGLFIYKTHDDFSYYHFQYSYYLTQQKSVIGLGNFDLGLRTPSSIFYLNSIYYLPIIKYFSFQITPALILGFSNLLLLINIKKDLDANRYSFITIYNLLIFIFINVFFYRLSEHGTDKSAQILILILFSEFLTLSNFKININKSLSKIFILAGLIISLKAFYLLYGIFFILILYHLHLLNLKTKFIYKIFIKNIFFISFIILFFLLFLHNYLNTSCLVYPVSLTCFENNFWSIKIEEVKELNNWYEQWSKGGATPNFRVENPEIYIKNLNWVSNWIDIYFFNKVSDFLLGLLVMIIITFVVFKSKKKKIIKQRKKNLLVFLILILLFEWFWNHPALRYGGYCLIVSVIFIYFSIYIEKFQINKKMLIKKIILLVVISLVIFSFRNIKRIKFEINTYDYKPLNNFYYKIDQNHFNLQNTLDSLIANYENCKKSNDNCDKKLNKIIKVDKMNKRYIFYRIDD